MDSTTRMTEWGEWKTDEFGGMLFDAWRWRGMEIASLERKIAVLERDIRMLRNVISDMEEANDTESADELEYVDTDEGYDYSPCHPGG